MGMRRRAGASPPRAWSRGSGTGPSRSSGWPRTSGGTRKATSSGSGRTARSGSRRIPGSPTHAPSGRATEGWGVPRGHGGEMRAPRSVPGRWADGTADHRVADRRRIELTDPGLRPRRSITRATRISCAAGERPHLRRHRRPAHPVPRWPDRSARGPGGTPRLREHRARPGRGRGGRRSRLGVCQRDPRAARDRLPLRSRRRAAGDPRALARRRSSDGRPLPDRPRWAHLARRAQYLPPRVVGRVASALDATGIMLSSFQLR